jgi:hypothetical protein
MRPKKNGFYFTEGMPHSHPTEPHDNKVGKGSQGWSPYKVWVGDLWECPTCGSRIIVNVGSRPLSEHYQPGFTQLVTATGADWLLVKDC